MIRSFALLIAFVASASLTSIPATGAESEQTFTSPDAALTALMSEDDIPDAGLRIVETMINRAARASPKDGRWVMGLSLIATRRNDAEKAYKLANQAIELSPDDAQLQFHFGKAAFNNIGNVSFVNKGAVAKKGKKAYKRAIELDPTLIEARVGLANYYLYAPGIAGGSVKKAREIAGNLKDIEGGAAEAAGLLMQIESKEKNWDAFARAADEAIAAADDETQRQEIRLRLAFLQAFEAEQPEAALETIAMIRKSEFPEESLDSLNYVHGYCLYTTGDIPGAIDRFEETLRLNADAKNTRFLIAECYEQSGNLLLAAERYEEFAKRFSDDNRAKGAKKKAKKLRKRAKKKG